MILANLREQLTPDDFDLVVRLLGSDARRSVERGAAEREPDDLLDDPALPERLRVHPPLGTPSPALYLYVIVRQALLGVGIDDRRLSDYLGALLLEFGLRDRAHRVDRHGEQEYHYLTDIVADLEETGGQLGFLLRAHLGNFSLWIAGIFPDYVTARRGRGGGPDLSYYETMGARGYRLASDHRLARQFDLVDVYAKAADAFPALRVALNRLSDRLFFPGRSSPHRLLRQVADEFNLGA
jgi:hypothetical protein